MKEFVTPQIQRLPFSAEDILSGSTGTTVPTSVRDPETPGDDFE